MTCHESPLVTELTVNKTPVRGEVLHQPSRWLLGFLHKQKHNTNKEKLMQFNIHSDGIQGSAINVCCI